MNKLRLKSGLLLCLALCAVAPRAFARRADFDAKAAKTKGFSRPLFFDFAAENSLFKAFEQLSKGPWTIVQGL